MGFVVLAGAPDSWTRPAGGNDFYVAPSGSDSADGTRRHPWATITHAAALVGPGATVHVAPGTYNEAVVTAASGTASARITYISETQWAARIALLAHGGFAWKNTGSYVDIVGFEIAGTNCIGIGLGASFDRAIANNVHNSAAGCNDNPRSGSGIDDFDYATEGDEILSNFVHDVGIGDPLCGQQNHDLIQGIYQANAGGRIHDNISANNCGYGIHLWHGATHAVITNNTVVQNRSSGILIGSGDAPCTTGGCPGGDDFTIVRNNIVAYNGNPVLKGWGIVEYAAAPGSIGAHNQYSHNLSFQNLAGDFSFGNQLACLECVRGADPRFISMEQMDFRLKAESPAKARGTRQDLPAAAYHPYEHRAPRPDEPIDLGASSAGAMGRQNRE